MRPTYNLTDDELSTEFKSYRPNFNRDDLNDELVSRFDKMRAEDGEDRQLIDILYDDDLTDPDLLRDELQAANEGYGLDEFLQTDEWHVWDESNRSDMGFKDPERAQRCADAAEDGSEGSTHAEIIDDWRRAVECAARNGEIGLVRQALCLKDIENCYQFHFREGSLDEQVG